MSRKLYPMLFRILKSEDETRDALQDLMMKLWDKRKELDKCVNLEAYIITMARNYSFDMLKRKKPSAVGEKEEYRILNLETNDTDHDLKEKYEQVHRVIERLPEKFRTVICLARYRWIFVRRN